MKQTTYLLDTSALVRLTRDPQVRTVWAEQIIAGLVAVCPVIELEFFFSARSKADREELVELLSGTFSRVPMPETAFSKAHDTQRLLTDRGWHRSASPVDLLVAATAELNRLVLVHYDRDFERIEAVTGQSMVWLATPGSID